MTLSLDPTRLSDAQSNGKDGGMRAESGASLHGGAPAGLPVAARRPAIAAASPSPDVMDLDAEAGVDDTLDDAIDDAADEGVEEAASAAGEGRVGLSGVLESLLFVAGEPVDVAAIANTLGLGPSAVEQGLAQLAEQYKEQDRGLRLQVHNGKYQLVTAPAAAPYVEAFLNLDLSAKLSSAALETLAVVAYRQPVTRAQIEAVRGVDCAAVLRSLAQRGLIEEIGRLDAAGRPILYGVTDLFMQHFGLMELGELPPLAHEDADLLHAATALAAGEAVQVSENSAAAPQTGANSRTNGRVNGQASVGDVSGAGATAVALSSIS